MRFSGIAIVIAALGTLTTVSLAQALLPILPADSLQMTGSRAFIWSDDSTGTTELRGPVTIGLGNTRLNADNAVVWIANEGNEQRVRIALLGNAELHQGSIVRTERNLLITASVTGSVRLTAERAAVDDHLSALYQQAFNLREGRPAVDSGTSSSIPNLPERRWNNIPQHSIPPKPVATTLPTRPKQTFEFSYQQIDHKTTSDNHIAYVLTGGVTCRYIDDKGNLLEFVGRDVVLFTDLTTLVGAKKGADQKHLITDHLIGGYFEGDVQVYVTPTDATKHELRMQAERVYYEFRTDRAVLTDVVLHTVDMQRNIPIFIRAQTMRQLSQGEFTTEHVELTTSAFANPSYSMAASKAYVRAEGTGDPETGDRVTFASENDFFEVFGVPVFYLPVAGGTMTSRGGPLRGISVGDEGYFGYSFRSEWGLFESLGRPAPKDLDASYRLDYMEQRGVAGGLDATYQGGFISEINKDPWNFLGDLHSYFVRDNGIDNLGGSRPPMFRPHEFRGRAYFEHQHFFPDDWQAQIRLGYVSDTNFLTQWFPDEFRNNLPIDESVYLKHQHDSEVFTLLGEFQPNDIVTTSEAVQEQKEVERLPEIGYYRVGDSFADDRLTFFSENTVSGLKYSNNASTSFEQGLSLTRAFNFPAPGLPSYAYNGDPGDITYRGDVRQEVDWPITTGAFKIVPYTFGRDTVYSQSVGQRAVTLPSALIPSQVVTGGIRNRIILGAGIRFTTAFWKVDDSAQSDLFDIHRVRHVIEPELNLFTSAQSMDQNQLFIYDPLVDAVNNVDSAQIALRQRWQTKRGGPGRWRSVDFLTFNIEADLFAHQPSRQPLTPVDFRGLYYPSLPEASIPRNSVNASAQWRISDTTAVLADCSENLDRERFATASIGLAVQRDERLSYFIGNRYIADLHSNITTLEATYTLSRSYDLSLEEGFDFGQSRNVFYSATIYRKFDRFRAGVRVYYDETTNTNGVSFEFFPYGFGRNLASDQAQELAKQ